MNRPLRWALFALSFVCCIAGCSSGPPATAVSGKLLDNGEAVKPPENMPPGDKGLRLTFIQTDAEAGKTAQQYSAQIKDDGTFTVAGSNGKGIPPGKYRLEFQKGPMMKTTQKADVADVEIPKAASVTVEVDVGKKTAAVK